MRTLAIGDIHGCLRAFDLLLEQVDPQHDDCLITLGDYVDRGPDSKGVLDRLIELQSRTRLIPLRGNHDLMMLEACKDAAAFEAWVRFGNRTTPRSYQVQGNDWESFFAAVPVAHGQFLEADCRRYHENDAHFFVHANVNPKLPLNVQRDDELFWQKLEPSEWRPHLSGKTMICGHTPQRSGRPLVLDGAVCIDTWAYGQGWLTCLDLDMELYWQANQQGETRLGNLRFRPR